MSAPIRSSTLLPGSREAITLCTADGLTLVGELALPETRTPRATLICLHPLPTRGGSMDSHLYRKAAWRLPALADLAVLRFNTRGAVGSIGRSEGEFDGAVGEGLDVAAALDFARHRELPNLWLVGWSFGTDLALMYGDVPPVLGAVLLSPPLRYSTPEHLRAWAESGRRVRALIPELDEHLGPQAARERFAVIPQAEVIAYPGARHLWVGRAEDALDGIVSAVLPDLPMLPRSWAGPFESVRFVAAQG